jgi:hypothetical protein
MTDTHFLTPATGGYDPHIRLWNPLVSKKPVWLMKGHQTSVTHLLVNSRNASILISISRDKVSPSVPRYLYLCSLGRDTHSAGIM